MNTEIRYEKSVPPKKIGREVHFVEARTGNPRSGENSFVRLKNGDILNAYTEFYGDDWADKALSRISGFLSHDEGETWSESFPIFEVPKGYTDLMCVSLLRLSDGDIGMTYLARIENTSAFQLYFARSHDEGKTFTETPCLTGEYGDGKHWCFIVENDRLIELPSGRLLIAAEAVQMKKDEKSKQYERESECFYTCVFYSDDGGKLWQRSETLLEIPFLKTQHGLQEPGTILMKDGRLRMFCRTNLGCQYESYSSDEGVTWSVPVPMEYFKSPLSPMMMKHVGDYTVAVYNPEPIHVLAVRPQLYVTHNCTLLTDRTPLVLSVSEDGGESFTRLYVLEDDPYSYFCYPAIFDGGDYLLVSYYHSNRTEALLSSFKTVKIMKKELEE